MCYYVSKTTINYIDIHLLIGVIDCLDEFTQLMSCVLFRIFVYKETMVVSLK